MKTQNLKFNRCLKSILPRCYHLKQKLAITFGLAAAALLSSSQASAQCLTATVSSGWQNTAMTSQTGTFTATFDATPSASPTNSVVGLSNGAQTAYANFACLVRFNPTGDIDARNGGAYAAASTIPYSAGVSYHFRLVVNVSANTYSIFVTPAGGSELTVGSNYAFRISDTTLNWYGVFMDTAASGGAGTVTVCNFSATTSGGGGGGSSLTGSSTDGFHSLALSSAQTGSFTATYDATPSISPENAVVGLSNGAATAYASLSCIARFNPTGDIDAYNGTAYAAASTIPYSAGVSYHFRLTVNVPAGTYSVFVTPAGGSELTVGSNFAFRVAQTSLNTWNLDVNATPAGASLTASNLSATSTGGGGGTVSAPSFSPGAGTYTSAQNVTITSATSGASIRYTTNGNTPTETSGTLYSGPVNISATATLKALAYKSGLTDSTVTSATYTIGSSGGNFTAAQVLAGVLSHESSSDQVNTLPHINTQTRAMNVNVYQVTTGVFAYTSSMAIDDDGSDPDPDPDHQGETTWQDSSGAQLGAHHVPFYVLGDDCWDNEGGAHHVPCPHFYYPEHNITGLQFALIFYNGKVIGAVFGDTQTANNQTTSDNDARELGEASVEAATLLGIPSSGTTGGVSNGVTVVIFSGSQWVVKGTNKGTGPVGSATGSLNGNAQALVQKALNQLGTSFGL